MKITATPSIPGKVDLSALERYQETNPFENEPFRAIIGPGQSFVTDDKYYTLHNIQEALKRGWIEVSEFDWQDFKDYEIESTESTTSNLSLTKVEIINKPTYHKDALEKFNNNMDLIDAAISGGSGGGEWGTITGTLADQTDLQNALDLKADASGLHDALTATDSSEINFTLTNQDLTASLVVGSIPKTKLNSSVQTSLGLADSALQEVDSTHLRLDTSNDPLTGDLEISKDTPLLTLTDTTDNRSLRIRKEDNDVTVETDVRVIQETGNSLSVIAGTRAYKSVTNGLAALRNDRDFSFSFWMKTSSPLTASEQCYFSANMNSNIGILALGRRSTRVGMVIGYSGAGAISPITGVLYTPPTDGSWNHYFVTHDVSTQTLRMWVNGVEQTTPWITSYVYPTGGNANTFQLGDDNSGQNKPAELDEFTIWNEVKDEAFAIADYNNGNGVDHTGSADPSLVHCWEFDNDLTDEVGGVTLTDGGISYTDGKVAGASADEISTVIKTRAVSDELVHGETTFGDTEGYSKLEGKKLDFSVNGITQFGLDTSGDLVFPDNYNVSFGTDKDFSIHFNETDPVFSKFPLTPSEAPDQDYEVANKKYVDDQLLTQDTLQEITDNGSTTTNSITANSFITSGGTSSQFVKGDGSLDSSDYALTSALHDALTVTDSSEIDFTLTGQDLTASIVAGSIDETKLDASVNASLDLADSALQEVDSTHLRLDASNDPLTGDLEISKTLPEQRLTDATLDDFTRTVKDSSSLAKNKATRYNQLGILVDPYQIKTTDDNDEQSFDIDTVLEKTTSDSWSVSFWVTRPAATVSTPDVFIGDKTTNGTNGLEILNGTWRFENSSGTGVTWSGSASNWSTMKHYVLVANGTQATLYEDGVSLGTNAIDTSFKITNIGCGTSAVQYHWKGAIDEVALFNIALTSDDVSELYNGGSGKYIQKNQSFTTSGTSYDNLDILYHFDEGQGGFVRDFSGNENNGTLVDSANYLTWEAGHVAPLSPFALYFDNNEPITLATPITKASGDAWSVNVWLTRDGNTSAPSNFMGDTGSSVDEFYVSGGNFSFVSSTGSNTNWNPTALGSSWSEFEHFVFVAHGNGTATLYHRGDSLGTKSVDTSFSIKQVGHGDSTSVYWYRGKIDEFAIFDRALTSGEATDLYAEGNGLYIDKANTFASSGTTIGDNLELLFHLDEGSGNSIADSSDSGNNSTKGSGADWVAGKVEDARPRAEVQIWRHIESDSLNTLGNVELGDSESKTTIQGIELEFRTYNVDLGGFGNNGELTLNYDLNLLNDISLLDNKEIRLGTGNDIVHSFDATGYNINGLPTATISSTDKVFIQDTDNSDYVKTVTAQSIADLAPVLAYSSVTFDYYVAPWGDDTNNGTSWDTPVLTIQQAIDLADATASAKTIGVARGTYAENVTCTSYAHDLTGVEGAEATIIDANNSGRCFTGYLDSDDFGEPILRGFSLVNGVANPGGGCTRTNTYDCYIKDCKTGVTNAYGGGAYGGKHYRTKFIDCGALTQDFGGGVAGKGNFDSNSDVSSTDCEANSCYFYNCKGNSGGAFGGTKVESSMNECVIENCVSNFNGPVSSGGQGTINNCIIKNCYPSNSNRTMLNTNDFTGCTFIGCSDTDSSGIFSDGGTAKNCTFTDFDNAGTEIPYMLTDSSSIIYQTDASNNFKLPNDNQKRYIGAGDDIYEQFTGTNFETVGTGDWDISGFTTVDFASKVAHSTTTLSATGPTDNVDVSGTNIVFIDSSLNDVTIRAFAGGVNGQILEIVITSATNQVTLEHNEGTANQNIFLTTGTDETITNKYGGWTLVCNGSDWFDAQH